MTSHRLRRHAIVTIPSYCRNGVVTVWGRNVEHKTMTTKRTKLALAAAAVAVGMTGINSTALAQSADALIDKLVDKGILSVSEANALREESDKNFATAYSVKSGMPEWVTAFKINGDFRGRYESFRYEDDATADRNRFRYRARLGFIAAIKDNLEAGLRLTSSEPASGSNGGDPLSGNTTLGDNGSKKFIYVDLAYAKWSPINSPDWSGVFTAGKMENPFSFPTSMMFDRDYTPEGATAELTYRVNAEHTLKFNGGAFVLDELGADSNDPYVLGAQLRWDAAWSPHWSTALGASAWTIESAQNLGTAAIPNQAGGNTRTAAGALVYDYKPIQADASVTYLFDKFPFYQVACPVTLAGEVIHNPEVDDRGDGYAVGVIVGKSGKRGLWDLSYHYRNLEGDAWFEEFTESDFGANYVAAPVGGTAGYRSGTNVRGHIVRGQYSPTDSLTLGVTYWLTELIEESPAGSDSGTGRLQVDATLKF